MGQSFIFGGTSLLIMVGVGLDTVKQIEAQLQQRSRRVLAIMRIVLMGPPGAGKGTPGRQGRRACRSRISTGEIFRANPRRRNPLGP